jgi:hypothetical protein
MSWADLHQKSEHRASEAQALARQSPEHALELYADTAKLEAEALTEIAPTKLRTLGITAVSVVALWFKARRFAEAQRVAYQILATSSLPQFAVEQLQGSCNRYG